MLEPPVNSQHGKTVSCHFFQVTGGRALYSGISVFQQGGCMGGVGVWDPAARGIYSKLGENYSDTEAISPCHRSLMVPNEWWLLKRAWCGIDGIALAAQWLLTGANDPEGWLCIRAGSGHKAHTDLQKQWGEPSPCNDRGHLCAQGSTIPGAPAEKIPVQLCSGAVPRAWQGTELEQRGQPFAGDHVGFTWPKCFPGESHCRIPAAGDCHPARCRVPSASSGSRCWLHVKLKVHSAPLGT